MNISEKQKIRVKLRSYNTSLIVNSCCQIIDAISKTDAKIVGPITLPTRRKIYCILRSPHVDKDSREHLEIRTHARIIDIYTSSSHTIDSLMKLNIPSGVDIEVKL